MSHNRKFLRLLALSCSSFLFIAGVYFSFAAQLQTLNAPVQVLGDITTLNSDSTLNTTTTTTTETTAVLKIAPERIQTEPLKQHSFRAYLESSSGKKEVSNSQITWSVINGGGRISDDGTFQTWNVGGKYPNTVQAKYFNQVAFASVEIIQSAQTASTETNTTDTSDTTTTLTQSSPTPDSTTEPLKTVTTETNIQPTTTSNTPSPTTISTPAPTSSPLLRMQKPSTQFNESVVLPQDIRPSPSPTSTSTPKYNTLFQSTPLESCLRSNFSENEYSTYFNPATKNRPISELGARVSLAEQCYTKYKIPNIPAETQVCLKSTFGDERFLEIVSSQDEATKRELFLSSACFSDPKRVTIAEDQEQDPHLLGCLDVATGYDSTNPPESTAKLSAAQQSSARACFSYQENPAQPVILETPPEVKNCLTTQLSPVRLERLKSGQQPTAQEIELGKTCSAKSTSVQARYLPAPADIVPLIPTRSEEIKVAEVTLNNRETKNTLLLQGKALPNTLVDIYIFSDPLIVSTTTDANGNWSYELYYHLPEGEHKAYSVINHPEDGAIRSEVFAFDVAYAQTISEETSIPQLISVTPVLKSQSSTYLGAGLILMSLALLLVFGVYWKKTSSLVAPTDTTQEAQSTPPFSPPSTPPSS